MFFGEAYRAPMGERLGDFGNVLVTSRSAKTVADGTLHILFCESFLSSFHNPDVGFHQSVQLVHKRVDGLVGRRNLALEGFLLVRRLSLGQVLVQLQYPPD